MEVDGTPTDASVALLSRIAQGDREAFGRFYGTFAGPALGLIRKAVRDPAGWASRSAWSRRGRGWGSSGCGA